MRINLRGLNKDEARRFAQETGFPAYRGEQLFIWVQRGVTNLREMSDLPQVFKETLKEQMESGKIILEPLPVLQRQVADDGTRKYLFALPGDDAIESVVMPYRYGTSICISSQAGCRMGCAFCASTRRGLSRNLTAAEMASQILDARRDLEGESAQGAEQTTDHRLAEKQSLDRENALGKPERREEGVRGKRTIGHIVVMGTGEPFDNYENLSAFLHLIHEPKGQNFSMRAVTVSTCGIAPRIERFAEDFPQVNLAISLHAPNDVLRISLMPIAKRFSLRELMDACRSYIEKTNRRITFEYTLMRGVNDGEKELAELEKLLAGLLCHVNLIPLNRVKENKALRASDRKRAYAFQKDLEAHGIPATVRREMGAGIDAACGQLRLQSLQ